MIDYEVKLVTRKDISDFIEEHHYSKSINGCISDYCFGLYDGQKLVGAMFYGKMAMHNQYKKFAQNENEVIELRRLVCIDDTPKNTESYFISRTLKWLKKNTDIKIVVSYADSQMGHSGVVYKASNFRYLGKQKGAKVIIWGEKKYHDKSIRTVYKGKLKPFALRIIEALSLGEAWYQETSGKHTYVYYLRDKKSRSINKNLTNLDKIVHN